MLMAQFAKEKSVTIVRKTYLITVDNNNINIKIKRQGITE
jgi:hypothetical protein